MSRRGPVFGEGGLLSRLVDAEMAASIREDLAFQRDRDRASAGAAAAAVRHLLRSGIIVIPLILDNIRGGILMIRSYLKTAFRNLVRHKGFSVINITGLALGMAACVLLMMWVQDELSYDHFHTGVKNIHRVEVTLRKQDGSRRWTWTPYPMAAALRAEIPEIKNAARSTGLGTVSLRHKDVAFNEDRVLAVDPSFLRMFTFPLLQGSAADALSRPRSILLTADAARRYFGAEDAMGGTLTLDDRFDMSVTGVLRNLPSNSSLKFDFLVPVEFMRDFGWYIDRWNSDNVATWLELAPGADVAAVDRKAAAVMSKHRGLPDGDNGGSNVNLMPLRDLNLRGAPDRGRESGKAQSVVLFGVLAGLVLLIACINFMNLSTARASQRALEVGLRKVVGAEKKHLIGQFYGESLLIAGMALAAAAALVRLGLPFFNAVAGKSFTAASLVRPAFLAGLLGVALVTGLVSGSYPALYLSAFQPVQVLKGRLRGGAKGGFLRKFLIVTQFGFSVLILAGTVVVYRQLDYLRNRNIGYDRERLIYLPLNGESASGYGTLREALLRETAVGGVTGLFQRPTQFGSRYGGADWEGRDPAADPGIYYSGVDFDYVDTMKIQILAGRPFDRKFPSDAADAHLVNMSIGRQIPGEESANEANAFLINEELARWMGGTSAVGKRFDFLGSRGVVVGVMRDFHFQSLQKRIEPLALFASPRKIRYAVVRLAGGALGAALDKVKAAWKSVFPQAPFDYRFYDDDFGRMLVSETRMKTLLQGAAGLAIFIAGLGLFGLASFMTEQRRKEIGIRKVMGASTPGILFLLTREFAKWVILANLIAAPAAYLLAAGWLKGYAYRIALGWDVFALTLAGTLIVALATVGRLAFRSARANPVQSIKSE